MKKKVFWITFVVIIGVSLLWLIKTDSDRRLLPDSVTFTISGENSVMPVFIQDAHEEFLSQDRYAWKNTFGFRWGMAVFEKGDRVGRYWWMATSNSDGLVAFEFKAINLLPHISIYWERVAKIKDSLNRPWDVFPEKNVDFPENIGIRIIESTNEWIFDKSDGDPEEGLTQLLNTLEQINSKRLRIISL